MSDKLIVALDGSELSESALPSAVCLARTRGLALVLARIVPWQSYIPIRGMGEDVSVADFEGLRASAQREALTYLQASAARCLPADLKAETVVREGEPADALTELATEIGAFAIVMATHGRGGVARAVLGSVAGRVVHDTAIPVLLVRPAVAKPISSEKLARIIVPLDGSESAEKALEVAKEITSGGGTVTLLQVVTPELPLGEYEDPRQLVERQEASVRVAENYLQGKAQTLEADGRTVQTIVQLGRAAPEILEEARRAGADVILLATQRYAGPARWLPGSVADEVARHADRPVMLINARTRVPAAAN